MPVAFFDQQARNRLRQGGIRQFRGLAQGLRRGVQQPIGQGVGEILDHLVRGFTRGQQALCLFHGLQSDPIRLQAQGADGGTRVVSARFGEKSRDFLVDDQPPAATARCWRFSSISCCRSSIENKYTSSRSATAGSISRGTAKSTMKIGRRRRARMAASAVFLVMSGTLLAVQVMTMSA